MPSLLQLSLKAADLATLPARYVLKTAIGLARGGDGPAPAPAPSPEAEERARDVAAADAKVKAPPKPRAKPKPKPSPKAARRAARHEPTRGQAAALREEQRRAEEDAVRGPGEQGADGPQASHVGATIEVAPPWEGYDALTEDQVLDRLIGADAGLRAAVRLYEGYNGGRRQILIATEEVVVEG
jgi:hypothetical protein